MSARDLTPGDAATFTLHGTDEYAAEFDGQTVTVIRPLDPNNPASNLDEEVGPMYRLRSLDGREFDAFADELTAADL